MSSSELLRHAIELARAGKKNAARDAFLHVVEEDPHNELAWMWLAGLMDSLEDQIIACENVLTINPSNEKARSFLNGLNRRKSVQINGGEVVIKQVAKKPVVPRDPMEKATYLELAGRLNEALMIYKVEAAKAKDSQTFNEIYKNIIRVETIQADKIQYIPPRTSITRLTFAWPLLYLSLSLVQVGLKPLEHITSYLWFAFPWVVLGSYLVAVSEVRSQHLIWQKIFLDRGDGSWLARLIVAAIGWLLILVPMCLLILDSLNRLDDFQIPPRLF